MPCLFWEQRYIFTGINKESRKLIVIVAGIELFIQVVITFFVIMHLRKKKDFTIKNFVINSLVCLYLAHLTLLVLTIIISPFYLLG
jgi:hypothetical protein